MAGTRPVVLYGHSMGALIVLGYLLSERPDPDLVVLSSPALDTTLASWKKSLAPTVSRVAPTLAIPNGVDGSTLSRDPAVAATLGADPLAAKASTARFAAEALTEQARVRRDYAGLTLPTLVLHGLDDGLVPAQASEVLGTLPNVERRTYPGLRHELHNEPEGPPSSTRSSTGSGPGRRGVLRFPHNRIPPPGSACALRVWPRPQTRGT